MPPGRALVEFLFGGSATRAVRHKAPTGVRQSGRNVIGEANNAAQHTVHNAFSTTTAQQAAAVAPKTSSAKLVNYLVEVFSPLVHSPGIAGRSQASRHAYRGHQQAPGRRLLLNRAAKLHTSSQPHAARGFGSLRPTAIPRSTTQTGLGSARSFSSSRPVFENVIHNAPLGLRILGDADQLDMRAFRREMKHAQLKRLKQDDKLNKGKGRMMYDNTYLSYTTAGQQPAGINEYFPVNEAAYAATRPAVQLVLPLNPVKDDSCFLSVHEEAQESRFFSAMLMSDLRLMHDMYGRHHAKMRNIIQSLESAGCFEPDKYTGQITVKAVLDEGDGNIIITFYGDNWTVADVRQILGFYEGAGNAWFELRELHGIANSTDDSSDKDDMTSTPSIPSSISSEFGNILSSAPLSRTSSIGDEHFDDTGEYERVNHSMFVPQYTDSRLAAQDSYMHGVNGFIHDLDASQRPNFT